MERLSTIVETIEEFYDRPFGKGFTILELAQEIDKRLTSFSSKASKGSVSDGNFGGATFIPERDEKRLRGQLLSVYEVMSDGLWRSLEEIQDKIGGSQSAISARLRDLRKAEFGGYTVQRKHVKNGLHKYRLLA